MSTIPKKIWSIWCNFNAKGDGDLYDTLTFFINRMKFQHPGWEINIITKWNDLIRYVENNDTIMRVLDNNIIGPAHKADLIRYYLLKTYGGVWLDITTFIVMPIDRLLRTTSAEFICYYMGDYDLREWLFPTLGEMFELVPYKERIDKWKTIEDKYMKLRTSKFSFIPENYFICSTPNNEIVIECFEMLEEFYRNTVDRITDRDKLCYFTSLLTYNLINEVFDIDTLDFKLIETFGGIITPIHEYSVLMDKLLRNVIKDCGYFFNYLQLYVSIKRFCDNGSATRFEYKILPKTKLINSLAANNLCIDNICKNIEIHQRGKPSILLTSATYSRVGKYADSIPDRISWDNTYLGELLKGIRNQNEANLLLKKLESEGFFMFKFSSFTRTSPILDILKRWYSVDSNLSENIERSGRQTLIPFVSRDSRIKSRLSHSKRLSKIPTFTSKGVKKKPKRSKHTRGSRRNKSTIK
jgi:hypothetical protein